MYNGIGLQTARGSGTNGYVQRNLALVRTFKDKVNYRTEDELKKLEAQSIKGPNAEIREHARKRELELRCAEMEDVLTLQGCSASEVEEKVSEFRAMLVAREQAGQRSSITQKDQHGRPVVHETHAVAEAQHEKNAKLKEAFGISEYFVEGSSFDPQRKAKEDAARQLKEAEEAQKREAERLKRREAEKREATAKKEAAAGGKTNYAWVRTPSPEPEAPTASTDVKLKKDKKKKKKRSRDRSSSSEPVKKHKSKKRKRNRSSSPKRSKHHKSKENKKKKKESKTKKRRHSSSESSESDAEIDVRSTSRTQHRESRKRSDSPAPSVRDSAASTSRRAGGAKTSSSSSGHQQAQRLQSRDRSPPPARASKKKKRSSSSSSNSSSSSSSSSSDSDSTNSDDSTRHSSSKSKTRKKSSSKKRSGDDGGSVRTSVEGEGSEDAGRREAKPTEEFCRKDKRSRIVPGSKACVEKIQSDGKQAVPLNGIVKLEKSGPRENHKASFGVKSAIKHVQQNEKEKEVSKVGDASTGKLCSATSSLSVEKRETLRRLLTVSGGRDAPAVFGRRKIDSYKLSLTFPDEEEEEDEDEDEEQADPVQGLKSPLGDSRSPLKSKMSSPLTCNGEKPTQQAVKLSSVPNTNGNLSQPAHCAPQQTNSNKPPSMKIPPLHFRKLSRIEVGKNIMKGPLSNDEKATLPSLVDKSPRSRLGSGESKVEPLANGRLKLNSPLLPTPIKKQLSATEKEGIVQGEGRRSRSRSAGGRRSLSQRRCWSSRSRSYSRSRSRSRSKNRRSGSKSSRSRSRSFSRSRSRYRSRSPFRHSRSRSDSRERSNSRHRSRTMSRSRSRSRSRSKFKSLSRTRSRTRSKSRSRSKRSRTRSYSRSSSRSRSRSYSRSLSRTRSSSRSKSRSRSRSISIPRRRGSPSFLDKRRITSARKRPVPYHRPTPPPESETSSDSDTSWYSRSPSRSPRHRSGHHRRSRSRSTSWVRRRSPSYSRGK